MQNNRDVMLTVDEAGELLGTGPGLPARLVSEGTLDHVREGRHILIPQAALIKFAISVGSQRETFSNERVLYRISDVTRMLSLSRSVVFDLLRTGRLRSVKEGRARLIPASAVREYLALLDQEVA